MDHHHVRKTFHEKRKKSKRPGNKGADHRGTESQNSSVDKDPETIKSQQQTETFYRVHTEIHGEYDEGQADEKTNIKPSKEVFCVGTHLFLFPSQCHFAKSEDHEQYTECAKSIPEEKRVHPFIPYIQPG